MSRFTLDNTQGYGDEQLGELHRISDICAQARLLGATVAEQAAERARCDYDTLSGSWAPRADYGTELSAQRPLKMYRVTNAASGVDLGTYQAADEAGALDALARDAGYANYAIACTVTGGDYTGLLILMLKHQGAERIERSRRAGRIDGDADLWLNLLLADADDLVELGAAQAVVRKGTA